MDLARGMLSKYIRNLGLLLTGPSCVRASCNSLWITALGDISSPPGRTPGGRLVSPRETLQWQAGSRKSVFVWRSTGRPPSTRILLNGTSAALILVSLPSEGWTHVVVHRPPRIAFAVSR
ncbi:hypothetical protein C8Q78DRAFT_443557 [Trametes maxima]|nr:hypothetical protein C8Q78DRAFT_443557 [Trametes maxima]